MKAIVIPVWGGPEVMQFADLEEPHPRGGEVSIRVAYSGVNFADVMTRMGRHASGEPPVVPGLEVSGVVSEVGPGVARFSKGEQVLAFVSQGYAEQAVASADLTWHLPAGIGLKDAAGFPTVGITAFNMLALAARLNPGEIVLIWSAAGGVGSTAAQLAKLMGASMVIGIVSSKAKAGFAQQFGCDHVIVSSDEDVTERLLKLTDAHGADVILNAVGERRMEEDVERLADFGRLVAYGMASGEPGVIPSNALQSRNCSLVGYSSASYRRSRPHEVLAAGQRVLSLLQAGRLQIPVQAVFPLEDAVKAHQLIESRHSVGKILLSASPLVR